MSISFHTASEPKTCWRCLDVGLPELGIPAGQQFALIQNGDETAFCCADCYGRLAEQVEP